MPISSLVITLHDDPELQRTAALQLQAVTGVTLGQQFGQRLAATMESDSLGDGRRQVEALQQLSGVQFVDVIGINFEDAEL